MKLYMIYRDYFDRICGQRYFITKEEAEQEKASLELSLSTSLCEAKVAGPFELTI